MADPLERRLIEIVRASPTLMDVLATLRTQALPDWLVFSGAVYQTVWNAVTGRDPDHGIRDFDVGYFDPDTSWTAEDAVIRRVAAAFPPGLSERVEVRNQARVPIWFPAKFGEAYPPLAASAEALERFVAPAFAVAVRMERDDGIAVFAPFGLADTFDLILRPNPHRPLARDWDRIVEKLTSRWPELQVEAATRA